MNIGPIYLHGFSLALMLYREHVYYALSGWNPILAILPIWYSLLHIVFCTSQFAVILKTILIAQFITKSDHISAWLFPHLLHHPIHTFLQCFSFQSVSVMATWFAASIFPIWDQFNSRKLKAGFLFPYIAIERCPLLMIHPDYPRKARLDNSSLANNDTN